MTELHPEVAAVTERVVTRSKASRRAYLDLISRERDGGVHRPMLNCGNLAHGFAASGEDKPAIKAGRGMNIGIVTAYNDMLSAHQPYGRYPEQMKLFAREVGATAQVGRRGPRHVRRRHPGAARHGTVAVLTRHHRALHGGRPQSRHVRRGSPTRHLRQDRAGAAHRRPALRAPAADPDPGRADALGPRQQGEAAHPPALCEGKVGRDELLESESASYHGAGTCTFYGPANSNQMMMDVMGLHLPGASFINPGTKLRQAVTRAAVHRLTEIGASGNDYRPLGRCVDEKAIVNAIIGLLATGGSTNHAIHLPAIARAAGIIVDWEDFDRLSAVIPQVAKVYPNGSGDVNHFHAAGGMSYVIASLIDAGLLHDDILTVAGGRLRDHARDPKLIEDELVFEDAPAASHDESILRGPANAFQPDGGMRLVKGNLGRATFKTSAVDPSRWTVGGSGTGVRRSGRCHGRLQGG